MGWATSGNVVTTNLDAATDSPASARADIKTAFDELKNVIDGRNTTNGVAGLDSGGLVENTRLPNTIISSGSNNLTLDPGSGKVAIQDILNLNPRTVAQLNALTSAEGDVAYVSNDVGGKALAVYDGSNWKKLTLGGTIGT
jgi:hypothetical protein|tara:strand:+ start:87 stop:509 length:423 start_codon:yes stop_codon:yes gene_type:complete